MFKPSDVDFMAKNMSVCVASIEAKLNDSSIIEFKTMIVEALEKFIEAIRKFEASGESRDLFSFNDNTAEKLINTHANFLSEKIENIDALQVLDALRHTFSCYAYNGLHQLYTRQENMCWHPKVVLTEILLPNDIDSLGSNIQLYRGCNISEYEIGVYGQAWTTSLKVANLFAYVHYQGEEWFRSDNRVVVETAYSKSDVLFSDQSVEFEVVVDVNKLGCVKISG